MKKDKRWIGVTALVGVTVVALAGSVVIKNQLNKGSIEVTQEGLDAGITQIVEADNGYKVSANAKGFSTNPIELEVTIDTTNGTVTKLEVISQDETPNLGANVVNPEFLDQFTGATLPIDSASIDALSGATITTNGVLDSIQASYDYLMNYVK